MAISPVLARAPNESVAVKLNRTVEKRFASLGLFVGRHPVPVLVTIVALLSVFIVGMTSIDFENDVLALWIRRGSRLHDERDFIEEHFGDLRSRTNFILVTPKSSGGNLMTAEVMGQWLALNQHITQNVAVQHDGQTYRWNDVCDRIPNPFLDLPCSKITVLDCFQEGDFDFFLPPFPGVPPNLFTAKPSFVNKTDAEVMHIVKNSCRDWSNAPIPENFMMGGVRREPAQNNITSVYSLQMILEVAGIDALAKRIYATSSPSGAQKDEAEKVILKWEQAYMDKCRALSRSEDYDFEIEFWAKRSESDLMKDVNDADAILIVIGYLVMIAFAALALSRRNPVKSQVLAGVVGVLLVCLGVFASLGLSAWMGITFTHLHIQVLPFLALGLGVDDMFVLTSSFKHRHKDFSVPECASQCLAEVGVSVTLTSLVNFIAFIVGGTMPLPAISLFSQSAAVVVAMNYIIIVLAFSAVLVLDARRARAGRIDCLPCMLSSPTVANKARPPSQRRSGGLGATETEDVGDSLAFEVSRAYGTLMSHWAVKVFVLLGAVAMIACAAVGSEELEEGLPLSDIVPTDHYSHDFLAAREEYYTDYEGNIVTGMSRSGKFVKMDYPNMLGPLMAAESALQGVQGVNPDVLIPWVSWVDNFVIYVYENHPENMTAQFLPEASAFYPLLYEWLQTARGVSFANKFHFAQDGTILATRIRFFQTGIRSTSSIVSFIEDSRDVIDKQGLPIFPSGYVYDFFEQYIGVHQDLLNNLLYTTLGISLAALFVLFHPGACLIMVATIAVIIFELYGLLSYFNLKLNGISIVNIVLAVGVSVEFTAHVTRSFMTAIGSRDERMRATIDAMGVPVVAGGVSTVLGVSANAFATFPYFELYFFKMYMLMVLCGFINGLIVLPVVLSLIGPAPISSATEVNRSVRGLSAVELPAARKAANGSYSAKLRAAWTASQRKHGSTGHIPTEPLADTAPPTKLTTPTSRSDDGADMSVEDVGAEDDDLQNVVTGAMPSSSRSRPPEADIEMPE